MEWLALALEALRLVSSLAKWWIALDDETRKQIRTLWSKLEEAEKNGTQANFRSAVNRLNADL